MVVEPERAAPPPQRGGATPEHFYKRLPGAFVFPFRGLGWAAIIAGALVYWVVGSLLSLPVFGLFFVFRFLLAVLAGGYLCAFMMKIIGSSAGGSDSLPDWPDVTSAWDDICKPLLLFVAAPVASFLPLIVYAIVRGGFSVRTPWFWALLGFGVFYLPMGLTAVALFESVVALNPVRILTGIVKALPAYLVVVALFIVVFCLGLAVQAGASARVPLGPLRAPLVGSFAARAASLYLLMVGMHLLGLLYQTHARRLGWFEG